MRYVFAVATLLTIGAAVVFHPVIGFRAAVLAAWGKPEERQRSPVAGFDHDLLKPIEPAQLAEILGR